MTVGGKVHSCLLFSEERYTNKKSEKQVRSRYDQFISSKYVVVSRLSAKFAYLHCRLFLKHRRSSTADLRQTCSSYLDRNRYKTDSPPILFELPLDLVPWGLFPSLARPGKRPSGRGWNKRKRRHFVDDLHPLDTNWTIEGFCRGTIGW